MTSQGRRNLREEGTSARNCLVGIAGNKPIAAPEKRLFPKHRPIRLKGKKMAALRQQAMERDGGRCIECGSSYWLELSHDIPRGRGGSDVISNVHMRCKKCHIKRDLHGMPGHF